MGRIVDLALYEIRVITDQMMHGYRMVYRIKLIMKNKLKTTPRKIDVALFWFMNKKLEFFIEAKSKILFQILEFHIENIAVDPVL